MPLQKAPPAEGEMKLRHGFCRQSLRLISFATSLCTREAFAFRRLQTIPRRAGVLAKPCKRPAPPPGAHRFVPKPFPSAKYAWTAKKPSDCFPLASGRGAGIRRDSSGAFVRPWEKGQKPGRFRRTLLLDRPGPAAIMGNRGGEKYGPFEPG